MHRHSKPVCLTLLMASVIILTGCSSGRSLKQTMQFSELNLATSTSNPSQLLSYNSKPTQNHLLILAHEYQRAIQAVGDDYYVRPGLYADYAVALARLGYEEEAAAWFNKEAERFPVSKTYVDELKRTLVPQYANAKRVADTVSLTLPVPVDEEALAKEIARQSVPPTREELARERAEAREQAAKEKKELQKEREQERKEAAKEKKQLQKEKEKAKKQAAKEKEAARKEALKEKEAARKQAMKEKEEALKELQERRKEEQKAMEQERKDNIRLGKEKEKEAKQAEAEKKRQERGQSKMDRAEKKKGGDQ